MAFKKHSTFSFLFEDSIIPSYVPFYYRVYLLFCKLYASLRKRLSLKLDKNNVVYENKISKKSAVIVLGNQDLPFINKTYSTKDEDLRNNQVQGISHKINELKEVLKKRGLKFTNAAGNFKQKDFIPEKEENKMWENAWMVSHSQIKEKDVILDIGGASSIFSYFLASMGCKVYVVDNDVGNNGIMYNSKYVSSRMDWNIVSCRRDVSKGLPFASGFFDKVFCVCVLEHLTSPTRRRLMGEINRVLKPGGIVGITFDYAQNRNDLGLDKGIRFSFKSRIMEDIITPSKLKVYGNQRLLDDCDPDFFLGSLFLKK